MENHPTNSTCGKKKYLLVASQAQCITIIIIIIQVVKKHVDTYQPGRRIPKCQLLAVFDFEKQNIPTLRYRVKLIGAKDPYNVVAIEPPIPPGTCVMYLQDYKHQSSCIFRNI